MTRPLLEAKALPGCHRREGEPPSRPGCATGSGSRVPPCALFPAATMVPNFPRRAGEETGGKAPLRTSISPSPHPSQTRLQPPQPSGPAAAAPRPRVPALRPQEGPGEGAGPGRAGGCGAGPRRLFSPAARRGGPGLSEGLTDLKFWRLNERNTQLTKQCATEEVSSGLAKSLLSFHLFSPNNSCPLIPRYSAVKNKTSL